LVDCKQMELYTTGFAYGFTIVLDKGVIKEENTHDYNFMKTVIDRCGHKY